MSTRNVRRVALVVVPLLVVGVAAMLLIRTTDNTSHVEPATTSTTVESTTLTTVVATTAVPTPVTEIPPSTVPPVTTAATPTTSKLAVTPAPKATSAPKPPTTPKSGPAPVADWKPSVTSASMTNCTRSGNNYSATISINFNRSSGFAVPGGSGSGSHWTYVEHVTGPSNGMLIYEVNDVGVNQVGGPGYARVSFPIPVGLGGCN